MSVRLFKNRWLESVTVMPLKVFSIFWFITFSSCIYFLKSPSIFRDGGLFLLGLALWTIIEYIFHRYLFHASSSLAFVNKTIFIMHGNHHEDPGDPMRNLMPLIVTIPAAAIFWYLFTLPSREIGQPVFAGFLLGYISYDLVHYWCHQGSMKSRLGRLIKRHHMLHHHASQGCNYGVTTTLWDKVFKTRFLHGSRQNSAPRS